MESTIEYLQKLFIRAERHIKNKDYVVRIINAKRFKECYVPIENFEENIFDSPKKIEEYFVFDEQKTDEYICNLLIYKWLEDHKDSRYKDFSFILKPYNVQFDMRDVSFDDLLKFISPQTEKSSIY